MNRPQPRISLASAARVRQWDVNSVMEMGYDDGKNYAYADVPNNRKLLDTVVRDDAGKVIPISKRFDKSKSDSRF